MGFNSAFKGLMRPYCFCCRSTKFSQYKSFHRHPRVFPC